jgi:hypothetical protein
VLVNYWMRANQSLKEHNLPMASGARMEQVIYLWFS